MYIYQSDGVEHALLIFDCFYLMFKGNLDSIASFKLVLSSLLNYNKLQLNYIPECSKIKRSVYFLVKSKSYKYLQDEVLTLKMSIVEQS